MCPILMNSAGGTRFHRVRCDRKETYPRYVAIQDPTRSGMYLGSSDYCLISDQISMRVALIRYHRTDALYLQQKQ